MKRESVLFISKRLNCSGAAVHMRTLGMGLQKQGWDVAIAARDLDSGTSTGEEWFAAAGFATKRIPLPALKPHTLIHDVVSLPCAVAQLRSLIRSRAASVVHVHAPTMVPFVSLAVPRDVALVSSFHLEQIPPWKRALAKAVNRFTHRGFGQGCFAISAEMAELLTKQVGIESSRVFRIPYSVDESAYRPPAPAEKAAARSRLGVPVDGHVVCTAGHVMPRKNQALVIKALGRLRTQGLCPSYLIAGSIYNEAYRDELEHLAERHGVSGQIRFLGFVDPRETYWASDVFVLPSIEEGFGLVVIEAMLSGLAVIRTPTAGAKDQIIEGETGFLTPPDSPKALADHLVALLGDEEARAYVAGRGRAHAREHFSIAAMTESTLRGYEAACAGLVG
jgi:glycosyltransferase involved in cell wall biosynthesis